MNSTNLAPGWGVYGRIVGMVALWGASYSWAKIVSTALPPISAACLRFFLAAGALLLWLHHLRRVRNLLKLNWRQWGGLALAALSGIVIYTICFMYGMRYIDASRAAVLFALNPVLTLLMAALIFRERLNGLILGGMLLAVAGSMVVVADGNPLGLLRGGLGLGEGLIFGCVVCWTGYTLIGRKILAGLDALSATVATLLLGALLLLPVSLLVEGTAGYGALLAASPPVWAALLALTWQRTDTAGRDLLRQVLASPGDGTGAAARLIEDCGARAAHEDLIASHRACGLEALEAVRPLMEAPSAALLEALADRLTRRSA